MSDKNKKMKKSATATTAPLRREAKKEKCLPEKCLDCPVKDICHGEPEKVNLDNLFKSGQLEEVKEEDLPDEIKKFVSDVKGLGLGIKVEAREMKLDDNKNIVKTVRDTGDGIDKKILELSDEFSKKVYATGFKGHISIKTKKFPEDTVSPSDSNIVEALKIVLLSTLLTMIVMIPIIILLN